MTEAAAPTTAPTTPVAPVSTGTSAPASATSTPNAGSDPQPSGTSEQKAAARVELAKMDPGTIVSLLVDGQEVEMKASEAFKLLGRNVSANKKFEEAAQERKAIAREREQFKAYQQHFTQALSDPRRFRAELSALGMSPKAIASAILQAEEADAALTPEQRKLREYEERDAQRQEQEQRQQREQFEAQRSQHRDAYEQGFNKVMTAVGIPEDHVARDVLLPTLARIAAQVQENEGRDLKVGEAKQIVRQLMQEMSGIGAAPMTDEQRRALITDADYEAWMQAKKAQRPQAAPAAERPRDRDGKFLPSNGGNSGDFQRNVHGERVVQNLSSVWGDKM